MKFHIVASAIAISASAFTQAQAGQIWLTMDQVQPYFLKQEAGQIVVGNPAIADVSVQDKSRLLLFGKGPGLTNIFIFDEDGKEIENMTVRVRSSDAAMLFVQRGPSRTTYNCMSQCEPTVTVGDDQKTFQSVVQQTNVKFDQAAASGSNN
ncbi:MAG: pilus assembly protein N-terminal domain-containing protein [Pseudomonadota bacterium]